jgi:hypothetical protein
MEELATIRAICLIVTHSSGQVHCSPYFDDATSLIGLVSQHIHARSHGGKLQTANGIVLI